MGLEMKKEFLYFWICEISIVFKNYSRLLELLFVANLSLLIVRDSEKLNINILRFIIKLINQLVLTLIIPRMISTSIAANSLPPQG